MTIFQSDKNYWEVNNHFKIFFNDVYDEDKSKDKRISSLKMWCIAYYTDPGKDNVYANMLNDEKKQLIVDSFLKSQGVDTSKTEKSKKEIQKIIDWDLDAPYIERYLTVVSTKPKKLLRKWEDKIEELTVFANSFPISENTYEMVIDIFTKIPKMWQEYARIKKTVDEETTEQGFGGQEKSFLEKYG